jgi:hypothetical protein
LPVGGLCSRSLCPVHLQLRAFVGAILSAVGMFFVVLGILQADSNVLLMAVFLAVGAAFLAAFFLYIRSRERAGKEALLSTGLFKNRTSNLGLVTQNAQWFILMGTSFVVAVYLQTVRGYNAIETGVIFTAATLGILVSSLGAERFARKRTQRTLIVGGFVVTLAGIGLLLGLVPAWSSVVAFVPGLLLIGSGLGVMLTPSVNVVPVTTAEIGPRGLCEHRDARVLSRWLGSSPGWTRTNNLRLTADSHGVASGGNRMVARREVRSDAVRSGEVGTRSGTRFSMLEPRPTHTNRLQCVECSRVSLEDERGWTARLTTDDEVLVYCPECNEREFGADD